MKEVFGYLRVSGRSQVDGDGFDRQKAAIQDFCSRKGWVVIRFFQEKGVSGTVESTDRPAFGEMLALTGDAMPTTVVVERIDRLARDLIISELLFDQCRKCGVEVYGADTGEEYVHADSDPSRKLIRQVLGAVSEFIKSELVKKLRAARDRKALLTGKRCGGRTAFEDTPGSEKYIRLIFLMRETGLGFRQIARKMNREFPNECAGKPWNRSVLCDVYNRALKKRLDKPLWHGDVTILEV